MNRFLFWIPALGILVTPTIDLRSAIAADPIKAVTSQLTVTGTRCVSPIPLFCQAPDTAVRKVILQATESKSSESTSNTLSDGKLPNSKLPNPQNVEASGIRAFKVLATDFERTDKSGIISTLQVAPQLDRTAQLLPGKFLSIPVEFKIGEASKSGEFSGTLLIEHSQGDLSIPVALKLKDSIHFALLVLGVGVLLAVWLSTYQATGLDRDEISGQVARLRSQMQLDNSLDEESRSVAEIFRQQVEALLVDVANALDTKNWTEARKSLTDAQVVWTCWRKQRNDWIDQYRFVNESLRGYMTDGAIPEETNCAKALTLELNTTLRRMPSYSEPKQFAEFLAPVRSHFQRYLDASTRAKKLDRLFGDLSRQDSPNAEFFQADVVNLKNELDNLTPSNEDLYKLWNHQADRLEKELEEAIKKAISQPGNSSQIDTRSSPDSLPVAVQNIPTPSTIVTAPIDEKTLWWGQFWLQLYQGVGQGAAIVLLCGVGLNQLYGSNPIFGANPIGDYTSLLAWGFSAEVTRESIGKVLQRFKLPGLGEK